MIYYVLNGRFPTIKAYGLQVAKTCEALKRSGSDICLIVPARKRHRELYGKSWQEIYGVKNNFRLVRLPSLDLTWLGLGGAFFFALQQLIFAFLVWVYLLNKKGIVYSRDQFTLSVLNFFGRRDLFWEVHRLPDNINAWTYRRLLPNLSGIVVISHGLKNKLVLYFDNSKILVAPDGIDIEEFQVNKNKFDLRKDLSLPSDKNIVMYTGHLFEWKGADTFVEAAQSFNEEIQAVIVGGTREDISRLKKLDLSGRVSFEGFKEHSEIPLYLASADIVVLPNKKDGGISELYTSPLKMFEYMASGKPIVASDLPSIREVLSDKSAVLVKPGDPSDLREGILNLLQNPQKMAELGQTVQAMAGQYAWAKRGQNIAQFIYGLSD